ncbi:hypothetical protein [Bacillus sp. XT-2]|uniref:hypothetical protein n=1 Tax=Bacillus sp. XT-2 TaxID=2856852 RepID=UPI0021E1131B|nr:hypothetical protein [Bacillus sp. XT-2]MCV0024777.1 hypothetical protein [Bacillus sp. XT-2]
MKILEQLAKLREEINKESNKTGIIITTATIQDRDINGGLDWFEERKEILFKDNQWVKRHVEEESLVQQGLPGTKTEVTSSYTLTDEEVEEYFNGARSSVKEVTQLISFFEKYDIK